MIGFRVLPSAPQIPPDWVEKFRALPVANISDVMARLSGAGAQLRPMHDGSAMAGTALTVRTRPGDNLMIHKALDMARAGDVIVVDAGGDLTNALIGELMVQYATHRGVAGIVLHGAIRDSAVLAAQTLPIFAAGITHRGPYRDGPGEINVPITIDGMVVQPGDLVLGDADGLLALPRTELATIYADACEKSRKEQRQAADGDAGIFHRAWVDQALIAGGCQLPESLETEEPAHG